MDFTYTAVGGFNGFSDNFERANSSDLGSEWTEVQGDWIIEDGDIKVSSPSDNDRAVLVAIGNNPDTSIEMTVSPSISTPNFSIGVIGRHSSSGYYGLYLNQATSKLELYRVSLGGGGGSGGPSGPGGGGGGDFTINFSSFPTNIDIVLGPAWDGQLGFSEDDVVTLTKASTDDGASTDTVEYTEDGTQAADINNNRIRLLMRTRNYPYYNASLNASNARTQYLTKTGTTTTNFTRINVPTANGGLGANYYQIKNTTDTIYTFLDVFNYPHTVYTAGGWPEAIKSMVETGAGGGGASYTLLDDAVVSVLSSHTIKLTMFGTAIKGFLDGSETVSATDGTFTDAGELGVGYKENA